MNRKYKMLVLLMCVMFLVGCGKIKEEISIVYGEEFEINNEELNAYDDLEWTVEDTEIATITDAKLATTTDCDNTVLVTGLAPGKTTITVNSGGKCVATYNVDVSIVPITSIVLSTNSMEIEEGETAKLSYTLFPENASEYGLKWNTADENIIEIDENGNIKAISVGQTTVTISSEDGLVANCTINVNQKSAYDRLTGAERNFVDTFMEYIYLFKNPYSVKIIGIENLSGSYCVGVSGENGFGGSASSAYLIAGGTIMDLEDYSYLAVYDDSYDLVLINEAIQEKLGQ